MAVLLTPAGTAQVQNSGARVTRFRSSFLAELGVPQGKGLSLSPLSSTFLVIERDDDSLERTGFSKLQLITQFDGLVDSISARITISDPINLTFDSELNRWFLLDSKTGMISEIGSDSRGRPDPVTVKRYMVQGLEIQEPVGMTYDSSRGRVVILDEAGPALVAADVTGWPIQVGEVSRMDLSGTGLGNLRGVAFDPTTGHYHVYEPGKQLLHELSGEAQIVTTRDLSEIGAVVIQGLLFAPSADRTDDPMQHNLYLIDGESADSSAELQPGLQSMPAGNGEAGRPGRLIEVMLQEAPAPAATSFQSILIQTIDVAAFTPPSPDTAGITYIESSDKLLFSDSEVNEMPIFTGDNLFEMTSSGTLIDTTTTTAFSNEPTGVAFSPINDHVFISDDDRDEIYEVDPGADAKYGTSDDVISSFDTRSFNSTDPEGVAFDTWQQVLFIVDGVNAEVYELNPGANGSFDGVPPAGDDQVQSFDTLSHGIEDPEGITFNKDTGNLYVVGKPAGFLAEFTSAGDLVQTIDISAASADKPAGLAFAPGSQNPEINTIYITQRGVDNNSDPDENDGKVFEMTLPLDPTVPHPPTASDDLVSTLGNTPVTIDVAANDFDANGNLDPGTANTDCSTCSEPDHGALVNNGDGSFTYNPNTDFLGDDSFVYEICDTDPLCDMATVFITVSNEVTFEVRVSASSDDAEQSESGSMSMTSSDLELVYDGSNQLVGMRFNGIEIPQDSTINHAYIQFTVDEADTGTTELLIRGEDVDNAVTFGFDNRILPRPLTAASVPWSPAAWNTVGQAGPDQQTPDLAPVIQEIVERPGWASGNSLVIIITGTGVRTAEAFDRREGGTGAPLLQIVYTPPGYPQPGNEPPVASDDAGTVAEGGTLTVAAPGVLSNDSDPEGNPLTVTTTPVTAPTNGILTLNGDGSYTYIHDGSETVADSFVYEVCDPEPLCDTATVNITINGVNDPPLASGDAGSVAEGGTLTVVAPGLIDNDSDPEGNPLTVTTTPVTAPINGILTLNGDGSYTYIHDGSETAADSFIYEVCDPEPLCATAAVSITITPINDPPTANGDTDTVAQGGTLNVSAPGLLGNDSDPEDDPLTVTITPVTSPSHGSLTLGSNGSYTYIHDGSETAADSFVYEVCDPEPLCATAAVNITIIGQNDPPVANDDTGAVAEGGTLTVAAPGLLSNDSDPENDPLTVSITPVTSPTNGLLSLSGDGSYTYIHDGSETVADSFVYEVCDPEPLCAMATVNITVNPVNDPPTANDDTGAVAEGGTLNVVASLGLLVNDTDPENDPLTVSFTPVMSPTNGTLNLNADGSYTYIHDGSETAADSFVYEVCDTEPLCATATVSITIIGVNDPPVAVADSGTVAEGGTLTVAAPGVLSNDSDPEGNPLTVTTTPVTAPINGILTLNGDGSYTYIHDGSETAADSFVYEVCDPEPLCAMAAVSITVTAVNDPPMAVDDSESVAEGGTQTVAAPGLLDNDSDPEHEPLTVTTTPVTSPTNGIVSLSSSGAYTYTHDGSETLADSFVYEVCDPAPLCATATVSITVDPVNDPPLALNDTATTMEGTPVTIDVTTNDSDPEGNLDLASTNTDCGACAEPTEGVLSNNGDGTFDYAPNVGFKGEDTFTYQICDAGTPTLCATATTTITVTALMVDIQLAASSDDAEERPNNKVFLHSNDLQLVDDKRNNQTVGMRFSGIAIPQGAQIDAAYIQFTVDDIDQDQAVLTIVGEADDNAGAFRNINGNISSRPATVSSVDWSPAAWVTLGAAGADQQTPDLASIVQEIIDRPGWSAGNSLVFIITGTGTRTARSYDGDAAGAPLLHIEYSTPTG